MKIINIILLFLLVCSLGKADEVRSVEELEKLIEKNPKKAELYREMGILMMNKSSHLLGLKNFKEAFELGDEASLPLILLAHTALNDHAASDEYEADILKMLIKENLKINKPQYIMCILTLINKSMRTNNKDLYYLTVKICDVQMFREEPELQKIIAIGVKFFHQPDQDKSKQELLTEYLASKNEKDKGKE